MIPTWLTLLSWFAVLVGITSMTTIAIDIRRHPQAMDVMNFVWPLTGLYGTLSALWFYWRFGRSHSDRKHKAAMPFPITVAKGTTHCGAGCTLGDILAECLILAFPGILTLFGYHTLFSDPIFAKWGIDYLFAFSIGIAFQYFAIVPMRELRPMEGVVAAAKADFFSLTAWQVGMYGFMAFAHFLLFPHTFGVDLKASSVEFWFMMQIAMMAGFMTAFPVNWVLIRTGMKEEM